MSLALKAGFLDLLLTLAIVSLNRDEAWNDFASYVE